jgi:hypothetical protein
MKVIVRLRQTVDGGKYEKRLSQESADCAGVHIIVPVHDQITFDKIKYKDIQTAKCVSIILR